MQLRILLTGLAVSALSVGAAIGQETYKADPAHANVGFAVSHLVINKVRGHFDKFDASLELDPEGKVSAAQAEIEVASVNTANAKRDDHLRSPDFFDAAQYPTITFVSTGTAERDGQDVLLGKFTIHGVTKDVELPYTLKGPIKDPWGNTKLALEAELVIDRRDYGLTWNKALEAGGVLVGNEVEISVNAEFGQE